MKHLFLAALLLSVVSANATLFTYTFGSTESPLGVAVTDGSTIGIRNDQSVSGIPINLPDYSDVIRDVNVRLNLSSGFNGDLYGYLIAPDGTRIDLLNRIGAGPLGNMSSGLNVILDDAAATSIQDLNSGTGGSLSYQASGSLSGFNDGAATGTWTLFLADLSGGDGGNLSTLVSWGLDLEVVPEPTTWALIIFAAVLGMTALVKRQKAKLEVSCDPKPR